MSSDAIAYVLLSGGVDSATAVTRALVNHDTVRCVSVNYRQRHLRELNSAQQIAGHYGCRHEIIPILFPRTMLTDDSIDVPNVSYDEIDGVSPTYVPFRNGLMLSTLVSKIAGELLDPSREGYEDFNKDVVIYWGAHAEDAASWAYPDCTPEFIGAMANAIYVGTYHKIRLVTPFAASMKHEIISYGHSHGTPYELTWSCYQGGELHCGTCATCRARREAFLRAGVPDPTAYVTSIRSTSK